MNVSWAMHQRMIVHKWKVISLMLRERLGHQQSQMTWRRNPWWLASLFGREMAAVWGHIGS